MAKGNKPLLKELAREATDSFDEQKTAGLKEKLAGMSDDTLSGLREAMTAHNNVQFRLDGERRMKEKEAAFRAGREGPLREKLMSGVDAGYFNLSSYICQEDLRRRSEKQGQ